jgi:hypothetical protein
MAETKNISEETSPRAFDPSVLAQEPTPASPPRAKPASAPRRLVEAWVKAGNAGAVNEVAERGSGKARKAARRGLNVLKARGVAIPERTRVASVGGGKEQVIEEAWLIAPDTQGTSVVTIASRTPTSRSRVVFAF